MIDLRSDTATRPTPGMRAAIADAAVGDEQRREDPSVNELEARAATLLGQEEAVFLPTATMANQIALRVHTEPDAAGHRPGFTLRRHTPQQVDAARHPYELPASEWVHLLLDDAVHGVGSRSCGLDVLPEHALWPSARAFTVWFPTP